MVYLQLHANSTEYVHLNMVQHLRIYAKEKLEILRFLKLHIGIFASYNFNLVNLKPYTVYMYLCINTLNVCLRFDKIA